MKLKTYNIVLKYLVKKQYFLAQTIQNNMQKNTEQYC